MVWGAYALSSQANGSPPTPDPGGDIFVLTNPPDAAVGSAFTIDIDSERAWMTVSPPGVFGDWTTTEDEQPPPRVSVLFAGAARWEDLPSVCAQAAEKLESYGDPPPTCSTVSDSRCGTVCIGTSDEIQVITLERPSGAFLGAYAVIEGKMLGDFVTTGGSETAARVPQVWLLVNRDEGYGDIPITINLETLADEPPAATGWGSPAGEQSTNAAMIEASEDLILVGANPQFTLDVLRLWGDCFDAPDCDDSNTDARLVQGYARFRDPDAARTAQLHLILAGVLLGAAAAIPIALGGFGLKRWLRWPTAECI
jgi:hypothetical protein